MPYEVIKESCQTADGRQGGAMIYKINEDGSRDQVACHMDEQSAHTAVSIMEEAEGLKQEDTHTMSEETMVHFFDREGGTEGIGIIEHVDPDQSVYHVRVYAETETEFVATDDVLVLPFEDVHDYMTYAMSKIDEDVEFLEDEDEMEIEEVAAVHGEEDEEKEEDEDEMKAIEDVDLQPTEEMAEEARIGLEMRDEHGRGGTEVGVARARDIMNRRNLSPDTIGRMVSYFARHEQDLQAEGASPGDDGYPSAGLIAWKLWGGDPGMEWANRKYDELEAERSKMDDRAEEEETKAEPDELVVGDFVRWESAGGEAYGRIEEIMASGTLEVPDTDFTLEASEDNPAALIEVYERAEGGWTASGVMVGHRFDALTKTDDLETVDAPKSRIMAKVKELDIEIDEDAKTGYIEGYASTYGNTDLGGDVVEKGAFKQTLNHKEGIVPLLLDHGYNSRDVAGVARLEDRDKGLYMKAEMPLDVPEVQAAYNRIKFLMDRGVKMGLSIGYDTVKSEPGPDGTRRLKELALHEISITPFPMNTEAMITAAKNRKSNLERKRRAWQTPARKKTAPAPNDAPKGSPDLRDALVALDRDLKQLIDTLTY